MAAEARLLGRAAVSTADGWLDFPADKTAAVLCYLAYRHGWVARDELLYLFWPDSDEQSARTNLRQLLTRIRRLSYAGDLQSEYGRVRWAVSTDVRSFEAALSEKNLAQAVQLYQGPLLDGFRPHQVPEFDSWLELARQELQDKWREAALRFAEHLHDENRLAAAADLLARLCKAEPLDEEVLRHYLQSLDDAGQRSKALASYESFRQMLQRDLAAEPAQATTQLAERIQRGASHDSGPSATAVSRREAFSPPQARPLDHLPMQHTLFVGRAVEQAALAVRLADPACRLVTIVGPGGTGKTRLALEAARAQLDVFDDGVWFVSLAAIDSPEQMLLAIAATLDFGFYGPSDPKLQLLHYLRERKLLLVLDNLEQLRSGIPVLAEFLGIAPNVKLLATARERLDLPDEWLFPLAGLTVPDADTVALGEARRTDAVQLFVQRASQVEPGFALDDTSLAGLIRICRLLEGSPLGLELAAAWVRLLTCDEIADELSSGLDFLEDKAQPERHRSLRQLFITSWRRLDEAGQTGLRELSVFRGGFTRDAAQHVARASMQTLRSLLDKSLLKREARGRFGLHELVRQYAAEKLAELPEDERLARERHCDFYAAFVGSREQWMKGGDRQGPALQEIEAELDNIRAAWHRAAAVGGQEAFGQFHSLFHFYEIRGRYQDGEEAFRLAANSLSGDSLTRARLLTAQAVLAGRLYRLAPSQEAADRSFAMLQRLGESDSLTYMHLGVLEHLRGKVDQAKLLYEQTRDVAEQAGDLWGKAGAIGNLGMIEQHFGQFDLAERSYAESIAIFRKLGDSWGLSIGLVHVGTLKEKSGQPEEARRFLHEALETGRRIGLKSVVMSSLANLGKVAYGSGDYAAAQALYEECLEVAEACDARPEYEFALLGLGETLLARGHSELALNHVLRALNSALGREAVDFAIDSVVGAAEVLAVRGEEAEALELATFSLEQGVLQGYREPEYDTRAAAKAERLQANLRLQLSAHACASAEATGAAITFEEIVGSLTQRSRAIPP